MPAMSAGESSTCLTRLCSESGVQGLGKGPGSGAGGCAWTQSEETHSQVPEQAEGPQGRPASTAGVLWVVLTPR